MPTLQALSATRVKSYFFQTPAEALDVDGYKKMALFLKVTNLTNGGSTLKVEVRHSARNLNDDYEGLWSSGAITSSTTTVTYIDDFTRFLRVEAAWDTANSTTTADVEVLVVPKVT